MKSKKVLPPTYLLISIILIVALHFLIPIIKFISFPYNLLGAIPIILGLIISILGENSFKKHETTVKPFEESNTLITNGVYKISRHPMYLGFALVLIGIAIFLGSLIPYIIIVAFIVSVDIIFIKVEEKMLIEKFGEDYEKYKSKVRRWI